MKKKRVVSRGRIKVDARRAVAKLREHLLLDPDAWPLEVVRVAAMCGATGVSVEHDADDLRIAFDGVPPASDRVARLLDFALESSRDPAVRALRLLAIALNATISTRPRRVTVAVRDDAAGDARFVFDPTLHARALDPEREGAASPEEDHALERTPIAREALRGASVVVEMNKGFSWGTFVRFASQRPLREVVLLHEATRRSTLPISFSPVLPASPVAAPVMIVALEEHGVAGGVLEVRADVRSGPRIAFLEHGVMLADVALPSSLAIPVEGHGVHLPLDVHVDAEVWPTNASRSQVHAREVTRIVEAIHAVVPAVGRALGAIARGADVELVGVVKLPSRSEAERAAAAFACCAAMGERGGPLEPMLDLPLARDAVGRPLSVGRIVALARRAMESAGAERVFVHRGAEPLPEAFAPFAEDVVWLGSSLADRILAGVHTRDFADVHRDVAAGIARRDAWLRQPSGPAQVPSSATELLRVAIAPTAGALAGLHGEVVIHVGRRAAPNARVLVDGRMLANIALDAALPFDAAIEWPGRLRPTLSFDTVVDDDNLRAALAEVARVGAAALSAHAAVLGAVDATPEMRALGRAALAADPSARRGPLAAAPLWPTAAGGWLSLLDIAGTPPAASASPEVGGDLGQASAPRRPPPPPRPRARRKQPASATSSSAASGASTGSVATPIAIAFIQRAPKHGQTAVPGGRPVLVLDAVDAHRLEAALERAVVLVPFGPAMGRVDDGEHRPVADALQKLLVDALVAQGADAALVVSFEDGPVRGLCATAARGHLIRTFAGIPLQESPTPNELPAIVVVEDARAVPTPKWDGLLSAPAPPALDALVALADAVRRTVVADVAKPPRNVVTLDHAGILAAESGNLRTWALAALGVEGGGTNAKSELQQTLVEIPCVRTIDEQGMPVARAPSEVRRIHPGATIPYLGVQPDFPTGGWRPLLVRSRTEVVVLERALGSRLQDGGREIARRQELYELEKTRQRLMAQQRHLFTAVPGAVSGSPLGTNKQHKRDMLRALVALRAEPVGTSAPCTLRYGGRDVAELTLSRVPPQIAVLVDTTNGKHIEKWAGITSEGRESAITAANEAAKELVANLITEAAGLAFESTHLGSPIGCELVTTMLRTAPSLIPHLQASSVTVESAFGDRVLLSSAWSDGPAPIARRAFAPEAAARVAQVPILLEPRHAALEQLLHAAGLALQDITRALAQATGDHAQPARLSGAPEHPSLRVGLGALGLADLDGELELVGASDAAPITADAGIEILLLGDSVRTAAPDLPFGVRAIARPKRLDTRPKAAREVAARIGQAAVQHLEAIAPAVEDLPPFVGVAIRAWILRDLEADAKPTRPLAAARAFVDVTGRAWSLKAILGHRIRFTTEGPPYPATAGAGRDDPAVFRLEPAFAAALRKAGGKGVTDVTRELRLDAEAEARAAAPPVPARLTDEIRRRCFAIAEIADGAVRGEVGLLLPSCGDDAKIAVHVGGRPVCDLTAPSGWPVVAVVADDSLNTNRRGDALAPTSQAEAIVQRVMRHRAELIARRAAAPTYPLASVAVTRSFQALDVTGNVWLDTDDPTRAGTVTVYWSGRADASGERLEATTFNAEAREGVASWPKALPVWGTLFVSPAAPHARLDGSVRSLLGTVVADSLVPLLNTPALTGSPQLARWKWAAALWGAAITTEPLRDASGAKRTTAEILRELRRRGVLWTSRHAGLADGDFPDEAPTFILLDDGNAPLLGLLGDHAPGLVRELGSITISSPERDGRRARKRPRADDARVEPRREPVPDVPRTTPSGGMFDLPPAEIAQVAEAAESAQSPERASSWISRVGSLVSELTGSKPLPALDLSHPLVVAVAAAVHRLAHPMPDLVIVESGRPISYVPQKNVLRVHLVHPTVAALLERGEVELLTAAAIGELNRVLEAVTDAEEARCVVALLERRAERRAD